jgi:hypothetical protein
MNQRKQLASNEETSKEDLEGGSPEGGSLEAGRLAESRRRICSPKKEGASKEIFGKSSRGLDLIITRGLVQIKREWG